MAAKTQKTEPTSSVSHIRVNSRGLTRLLVSIPLDQRAGLATLSAETGTPQQELIRQAIHLLLVDPAPARQPDHSKHYVRETHQTKAEQSDQVARGVSIVKDDSDLLHADLPGAEPAKKTKITPKALKTRKAVTK